MNTRSFLALSALFLTPLTAEPIAVEDVKGRKLQIEISKFKDDKVTFVVAGKDKSYTLPLKTFSNASQTSIKEYAKTMPEPLPEYVFDNVTVSKRRKDRGKSYWMEVQEIMGSISIKNRSNTETYAPCEVTLVVIGQDQRKTDLYKVLTHQTFSTAPAPTQTMKHKIESVFTEYDSDNKGQGNWGGFMFSGYIITVKTEDGRLVLHKEIGGMARNAVTTDPTILDRISEYKTDMQMTKLMETDKKKIRQIRVTRY